MEKLAARCLFCVPHPPPQAVSALNRGPASCCLEWRAWYFSPCWRFLLCILPDRPGLGTKRKKYWQTRLGLTCSSQNCWAPFSLHSPARDAPGHPDFRGEQIWGQESQNWLHTPAPQPRFHIKRNGNTDLKKRNPQTARGGRKPLSEVSQNPLRSQELCRVPAIFGCPVKSGVTMKPTKCFCINQVLRSMLLHIHHQYTWGPSEHCLLLRMYLCIPSPRKVYMLWAPGCLGPELSSPQWLHLEMGISSNEGNYDTEIWGHALILSIRKWEVSETTPSSCYTCVPL